MRKIIFILFMAMPLPAFCQDYSVWLDRCSEHREIVERILEQENVDKSFYYLMVAESKCTVGAESDKGAKGFWQLLPATSKHYGCNDPHDVECATIAAARYIRHLQDSFKKFDDVIAAYNMGGHNYRRLGRSAQAIGLINRVKQIMRLDHDDK